MPTVERKVEPRAQDKRPVRAEDGRYYLSVPLTLPQMCALEYLADSGMYGDGTPADAARDLLSIAIREERRR